MAELTPFKASVETRAVWRENVGKSDVAFTPAIVGNAVYAARRDGTIARFEDGKRVLADRRWVSPCRAVSVPMPVCWWSERPKGRSSPSTRRTASVYGQSARASSEVLAPPAVVAAWWSCAAAMAG